MNNNSVIKMLVTSDGSLVSVEEDSSYNTKNQKVYLANKRDSHGNLVKKFFAKEQHSVFVYQSEFHYSPQGRQLYSKEEYFTPYTDGSRKLHKEDGPAVIIETPNNKILEWWVDGEKVANFDSLDKNWTLEVK